MKKGIFQVMIKYYRITFQDEMQGSDMNEIDFNKKMNYMINSNRTYIFEVKEISLKEKELKEKSRCWHND